MNSEKKKVIIVGAGISGLCTGSYLQMNGFDTEIFELHKVPGGLCTSWKRKGYLFDGCIHWLCHTDPSGDFYNMWTEVVDMDSFKFVTHDTYMVIEDADGNKYNIYSDLTKLRRELKKIAPEDSSLINDFTESARKFAAFKMPVEKPPEMLDFNDNMKHLDSLISYLFQDFKWGRMSMGDLVAKCKNPKLQFILKRMMPEDFSAITLVATLADMHKRRAGYPIGGSLNFARKIEKRYTDLGGKVRYNAKVAKVNVKRNVACGVILDNGDVFDADIVISASDGRFTIFEMLGGNYLSKKLDRIYQGKDEGFKTFPSLFQISLGVAARYDDVEHWIVKELENPIRIDDETESDFMDFRVYNFDPTVAPENKTCIVSHLATLNSKYWLDLKDSDRKKYSEEKQRVGEAVIDALDKKLGGVKEHLEAVDVASPATFQRYTNNWNGVYESWVPTPAGMRLKNLKLEKTLPGLDNFYMAGQWVHMAGGLPQCVMSGRHVAQIICKEQGVDFVTSKA